MWNPLEIDPAAAADIPHSLCNTGKAAAYVMKTRWVKTLEEQIPKSHRSKFIDYLPFFIPAHTMIWQLSYIILLKLKYRDA